MQAQLISFETAKLAKKKGFDIPCTTFYSPLKDWQLKSKVWNKYAINKEGFAPHICSNGHYCIYGMEKTYHNSQWVNKNISAPTQALLQKWLRDIYGIFVNIIPTVKGSEPTIVKHFYFTIIGKVNNNKTDIYKTYEETLEIGLQKALKLI